MNEREKPDIIFWHSATVSSYLYDVTVALCQKNLQIFKFNLPASETNWTLMLKYAYIWHLQAQL